MDVRRSSVATLLFLIAVFAELHGVRADAQEFQREVDRVAEEVAASVQKAGLKNIAVVDFTDLQGNVQEIVRPRPAPSCSQA